MATFIGYALAALVGISLGFVGSGGSILTVPILVYVMGVSPTIATGYSLFIVGATALVGAIAQSRSKLIDFKAAVVFSIPSFLSVYAVRRYLMPALPEEFARFGAFVLTKDIALMTLFALLMLGSAFSMIRGSASGAENANGGEKNHESETESELDRAEAADARSYSYGLIVLEGLGVGAITGAVGAGGGFLIIPALTLLAKIDMRVAVGTSLLIIAAKSLIGFVGDVQTAPPMDWMLLFTFTALALGGLAVGMRLSRRFSAARLKSFFGWFLVVMSVYIALKEFVWR
jgi:uncharacterized membrane protein YfcA